MTESNCKRRIEFDVLRIVASFLVILLHVSGQNWGNVDPNSFEWKIMNVYEILSRSCVAIFFMISGAVFLKSKISISKLYKKYISRLMLVFIIWNFTYSLDTVRSSNFSMSIYSAFMQPKYHLWFLPSLICIYVALPLLYSIVNYEDGEYLEYYIIVFMLFGILKSTASVLPRVNSNFLDMFTVDLCEFVGYFVLGYYLTYKSKIKMKNTHIIMLFLITSIAAIVINQNHAISIGQPSSILYGSFTIPVFIEAVLIFMFFQNIRLEFEKLGELRKYIIAISKSTLGIYLVHPFVMDRLHDYFNLNSLSFNPLISIASITMCVFILSISLSLVLTKIPYINKYLV